MTAAYLCDPKSIDLSGFAETILITGGYGGIGAECVRHLQTSYPHAVILVAGRNAEKARAFAASHAANVIAARLDLASLRDVDGFAKSIRESVASRALPPLSALICNAGTQAGPREMRTSKDGFEETFAVNHLAHMHLSLSLLPSFAEKARLIVVSSGTHDPNTMEGRFNKPKLRGASEMADPDDQETKTTHAIVRYATSKLCNLLFAYEFARRAPDLAPAKHIDVLTYDPGGVPGSELLRNIHPFAKRLLTAPWLMRILGVTTRTPTEAGYYLAALIDREVGDQPAYWQGPDRAHPSVDAVDEAKAGILWQESSALISRFFNANRMRD